MSTAEVNNRTLSASIKNAVSRSMDIIKKEF